MKIVPVNYSNNYINRNKITSKPVFSGIVEFPKQPAAQQNDNIGEKINKLFASIFPKRKKKETLPYYISEFDVKTGKQTRKTKAKCYRYGNAIIQHCDPEVLEKVTANLNEMGITKINKKNMKVVRTADIGKITYFHTMVSYYDEDSGKSIVFTPEGNFDYKMSYICDSDGQIVDYKVSDKNTKYPTTVKRIGDSNIYRIY